ncbi:MAG: Gfo/Idh/MocA family oxidoreductase [Candidatus Competibacteraceae bacterium]|nr:Gfo/Idh/MocA family oxidoreductase [Candidatus Competibacteraceae bacterium]
MRHCRLWQHRAAIRRLPQDPSCRRCGDHRRLQPGSPEREIAERDYGLRATGDIEELLAWKPDCLLVASTSVAHAEQVLAASAKKVHIFCEKPIALNLADADRMIAAATGIITVVNYSMRFIDAYIKLRDMAAAGDFGTILSVTHMKTRGFGLYAGGARHRAVLEPQESGGWTVHHACHDVDFLYWLNGPMTSAYGLAASTFAGSEEVVHGVLSFASGGVGTVGDSVCGIRDHYTLVIGSKAQAVLRSEHGSTELRFRREGETEDRLIPATDTKRKGGGIDHFLDCVRAGRPSEKRPQKRAALAGRVDRATGIGRHGKGSRDTLGAAAPGALVRAPDRGGFGGAVAPLFP